VKKQEGVTFQIEKHSKNMKLDMIFKTNPKCYHISMYFQQKKKKHKNIEYHNGCVSQILEHTYKKSNAKFVCICGILLYIFIK
jgi:hypothetical protein